MSHRQVKTLTEKLHKTQDLLYDSTRDFLELRFTHRGHERAWMSDKDRLLRQLDKMRHLQETYDQHYVRGGADGSGGGVSYNGSTVAGTASWGGGPHPPPGVNVGVGSASVMGGGGRRGPPGDMLNMSLEAMANHQKQAEEIKVRHCLTDVHAL